MKYTILPGDCIESMRTLPEKSVHCCITSPPYYGLRDYGHEGQIGLEKTPDAYVAKMVEVFREVRRVLRDDGTVWLNLGDSYASSGGIAQPHRDGCGGIGKKGTRGTQKYASSGGGFQRPNNIGGSLKPKDLIGIPWRVAFALQADGWYLRQDIIWHKPNPMPESVTDRCTKAHEYIFLLTKSARYWYDAEAVKETAVIGATSEQTKSVGAKHMQGKRHSGENGHNLGECTGTRNRRSVWTVSTQPYKGAHFATFPPDLIRPCVQAGCPAKTCPTCGKGWERNTESKVIYRKRKNAIHEYRAINGQPDQTKAGKSVVTLGFSKPCTCPPADPIPGVVLDPFGGSGTTGQVALEEGRNTILCELNPEYIALMERRLAGTQLPLF